MYSVSHFPTEFAIQVARKVGLYQIVAVATYSKKEKERMRNLSLLLGEFQQIVVLADFDKAIGLYSNENLKDEQIEALKMIADFAPVQAAGVATESMMKIISENKDHRDYTRILELLMENLNKKEGEFSDEKQMDKLIGRLLDED